jgi:hypothetical protein
MRRGFAKLFFLIGIVLYLEYIINYYFIPFLHWPGQSLYSRN